MKPLHKKILSIILLLGLLAWLIYYGVSNYELFKEISFENPWLLIVIAIIFLIGYIPGSLINYYTFLPLGLRLKALESYMLAIITGFYNLITPFRGGMAVRAVYLKRKYNFTYTNFLATLAASYVLIFFIAAILGLLGILSIYLETGIINWVFVTLFFGLFLTLLFVIAFSPKLSKTKHDWLNRFIEVINGWNIISKNKKIIFAISIMSLLQILLSALSLFLQFKVFGIAISYGAAVFLAAMGCLSLIIGITPAGLGINEAIIVFSASTLGITPVQSLSAALAGRFVGFVVLFILGPIFSYFLMKKRTNAN